MISRYENPGASGFPCVKPSKVAAWSGVQQSGAERGRSRDLGLADLKACKSLLGSLCSWQRLLWRGIE
jgi:hypothetical protein